MSEKIVKQEVYHVYPIGRVRVDEDEVCLEILELYRSALKQKRACMPGWADWMPKDGLGLGVEPSEFVQVDGGRLC